jgi:hypothetical protein
MDIKNIREHIYSGVRQGAFPTMQLLTIMDEGKGDNNRFSKGKSLYGR